MAWRTESFLVVKGFIAAWRSDWLTIESGKKVNEIARSDVERISTRAGMSRSRRTGWGALIGGGVGAILYIALCSAGECDVSYKLVGTAGADVLHEDTECHACYRGGWVDYVGFET